MNSARSPARRRSRRYLENTLFGLTPLDPATFFGVFLLFAAVATVASYIPARQSPV